MSAFSDLASLPCIGSPKLAQTIIDEMRGRGWHFIPFVKPTMIADPGAHGVEPVERLPASHEWEPAPFDP